MASPWRLASMLLVSWIFLLYWTASSAGSHDLLQSPRIRRDLPSGTKEKIKDSLAIAKDSLTVFKEVLASKATASKATDVLKRIAKVASLAPGIGGLAMSIINLVLDFIPQENPLKELRKGFDEVNRKLDSLSIQISNLATDVEWFNYASVYSQDEVRILNAWNKLDEFRQSIKLAQSEEEKLHLAEIFTNHYESTGAEASVSSFYFYLTVSSTALSGNLNNLLMNKFKCDVVNIGSFNLYFSSLLWKGMVVSQVYWNLMGFNSTAKEHQHIHMFNKVHEAQSSAVDYCLKNYSKYMEKDVEEITKSFRPNKTVIAEQVKKALDKKYNWYSWVVLVYDSSSKDNYIQIDATNIQVDDIMVTVAYTLIGERKFTFPVITDAYSCFEHKSCKSIGQVDTNKCGSEHPQWGVTINLAEYVKVTHASYDGGQSFVERPTPLQRIGCKWSDWSAGEISVHWSKRKQVCTQSTCQNNGNCKRLLDSNDWLCDCQDGYHGDTCEKKMNITVDLDMKTLFPKALISTTSTKLRIIESKLDTMMSRCQFS